MMLMDGGGGGEDLMPLHLLSSMFAEYQLKGWNIVSSSLQDNALHVDFKFQTNEYSKNDAGSSASFAVSILQKLYTHLRVKRWTIVSNNRQIGLIHFSFTFEFRDNMRRDQHRDLIPSLRGYEQMHRLAPNDNQHTGRLNNNNYPDVGRLVGILEDLKVANEQSNPQTPYTTLIGSHTQPPLPPPRNNKYSSNNSSREHSTTSSSKRKGKVVDSIVELHQSDTGDDDSWPPPPPQDQFILAPAPSTSYPYGSGSVNSGGTGGTDSSGRERAGGRDMGRRVPADTARSVLSIQPEPDYELPPPDYETQYEPMSGNDKFVQRRRVDLVEARESLEQDRWKKYTGKDAHNTERQDRVEENVMRMFNGDNRHAKSVSNGDGDMAKAVEQYMSAALVSEEGSSVVDYRIRTATTTPGTQSLAGNMTTSSGSTDGSKSVGTRPMARVSTTMEQVELLCSMCKRPKTDRLLFKSCKNCTNLYCPDCVWWCIVSRKGRCVQCYYVQDNTHRRHTRIDEASEALSLTNGAETVSSLSQNSNRSKNSNGSGSKNSDASKNSKNSKTSKNSVSKESRISIKSKASSKKSYSPSIQNKT